MSTECEAVVSQRQKTGQTNLRRCRKLTKEETLEDRCVREGVSFVKWHLSWPAVEWVAKTSTAVREYHLPGMVK